MKDVFLVVTAIMFWLTIALARFPVHCPDGQIALSGHGDGGYKCVAFTYWRDTPDGKKAYGD